jgi:hypothetical protein
VSAVIDHFPEPGFSALPDRKQLTRVAAGIAISLAVHALLLSIQRQPQSPAPATSTHERLTVRLRAAPETPPAPEPARPAAQPESAPKVQARPVPRTAPPRRIIAVPPTAAPADEEGLHVDTPPAAPPPPADASSSSAPRFNLDAARQAARRVANEPDPAKVGTPLERLPPKPLETEGKLERGIKEAKRPLCKDGVPGGLLAPIFLMMDKKDSGCKW